MATSVWATIIRSTNKGWLEIQSMAKRVELLELQVAVEQGLPHG